MRHLKLHHDPDAKNARQAQGAADQGPFPFPSRKPAAPAFRPRLVTDSIANAEQALADVERRLAELQHMVNNDDDRPRAA